MTGIFISYRRDQNDAHAHLLRDRLKASFRGRVFMDVASTSSGDDFTTKIEQQLKDCRVMLVLIGPEWESLRDKGLGGLRLHNPKDWVRVEVATALKRNIRVIPVLVNREKMPRERDLPDDLKQLVNWQAFVLDLDQRLDQGMRDLIEKIRPDMGRGVSVPDWVKWAVPAVGLVAGGGGYLAMNPPKWVAPAPPVSLPDPFSAWKKFRDCDDAACPTMVVVPAGSFLMGSPDSEPGRSTDEGPQHRVNIAKFAMGQFEVTQGQWKALMGSNPSTFKDCGTDCPVESVSWEDAQEFAKRLSAKTGRKYRLPSEEEWEYAARAGTITAYAFGETLTTSQANVNSEKGKTVKMGSYAANDFGLSDMHGNVWEWVEDCYSDSYGISIYSAFNLITFCKFGDGRRVLRGGGWINIPSIARAANRDWYSPGYRGYDAGFRLARTITPRGRHGDHRCQSRQTGSMSVWAKSSPL